MRRWVLVICAATCAAATCLTAPVQAASRQAHDDCNAADPTRNIAGCTIVLEDPGEPATVRAIAHVGRGLAYQARHDRDRALADFTEAIRLNPNDALAYSNRGVLWREKGDIDKAIADFSAAIDIAPLPRSDLPGQHHVNVYDNRGLAYQAKGDLDRALADFDAALEMDRDAAAIYLHRSQLLIARREAGRAIEDLGAVIRLDPKAAAAHYTRGLLRYDQYVAANPWIRADDLTGAIADYTAAIAIDPTRFAAFYARALAHNMNGEPDKAVADLLEAVRLNPMYDDAVTALRQLKPDWQPGPRTMLEILRGPSDQRP